MTPRPHEAHEHARDCAISASADTRRRLLRGGYVTLSWMPRPILETLDADAISAIGVWHNILISIWLESATVNHLRRVDRHTRDMSKQWPGGFSSISVVASFSKMPNAEVRAEAERLAATPTQNARGGALIIEGTGLLAAAIRAMLVGMFAFSNQRVPTKIFDNIDRAAPWVLSLLPPVEGVTAEALVNAVSELRTRARARS